MNLHQIEQAYLQGTDVLEINELYKSKIAGISDEQKIDVWQQVCGFANAPMIEFLIAEGWRTAGIEDTEGNTLLHFLALPKRTYDYFISEQSVYECAKKLLESKVSPLRKNSYGETALLLSAKVGYFEMFQAYAEAGAKTDFTDRDGNTLLHRIAQYSNYASTTFEETMERLLLHKNDPNFDENNPRHLQERATLEWKYNVAQARFNQFITYAVTAMEFGFDPFQKNNEGETAVEVAIRYESKSIGAVLKGVDFSNEDLVPLYFQAGGMNVHQACAKNDVQALNALIQIGENINEMYDKEGDKFNGMTPLSIAMTQHYFEATDILLKNGADATLCDSKSWHPFRYVYTPVSGVNTNSDDFKNKVFQKTLQSYIATGFDINSLLDDDENTLLTLSARYADHVTLYNNDSVATALIEEAVYSNANVNQTNRDGISALMYLCLADARRGEKNLIALLEQGASTELRDKNGKTALMYAAVNSDKSVAKTYCELMAEFGNLLLDAKDNSEKSALDYAAEQNNETLVAWLVERM